MLGLFGTISNPFNRLNPTSPLAGGTEGEGLFILVNIIFKTMIIGAAIFTLVNFLLAGYMFLGASGDPKAIKAAWEKIYVSIIGLVITSGAFVIAALIGFLIFGDASILITPRIFRPQ